MKKHLSSQDTAIDLHTKNQFTVVYNLYYERLCFFAQRYTADASQAEDIIGELFARLWQKPLSFHDEEHLKAYLYRSAANACYTYTRTVGNLKIRESKYASTTAPISESFLQDIIRADVWAGVYQAIENLPPQCALVIKMSYVEGLKNPEIAAQLGLSLQTVKNHKQHGLRVLRTTISKDAVYLLLLYVVY